MPLPQQHRYRVLLTVLVIAAGLLVSLWLGGRYAEQRAWDERSVEAIAAALGAEYAGQLKIIFLLLIAGVGVKAALVPLHGWLPQAMVAPAPVSALLHAVAVVKAGAFGIVRIVYEVYGVEFAQTLNLLLPLAIIASITIVWGSFRALFQDDLKKRLAFSTVSQVSYIALGVALFGPIGTIGGLVHLVHQGIMKITLFFCAGNYAETLGIHKVSEMDGAGRRMPLTTLAFSIFVMRATRELSEALQSLLRLRHELEIQHRIASNAARTDELTGLNNLRAFKEQADTMFTASRCNGLPLCALLVDIDHFKQINDTHGHATGDRVLQAVAQALKTTLREADLCGRLGGEEFGVLLTGTNLHEALQLAEKLRLAIQAIVVPMDNTGVTISVGVAEAGAACADITTLLAQADAAMYHAKANGRNRVHGGSA